MVCRASCVAFWLDIRVAWSFHCRKEDPFASVAEQLQPSADRLELESRQQQLSTFWKRAFVAEKVAVVVSSMGAEPSFALLPKDLGEVEKVQVVNKVHLASSAVGTYDALMASSNSIANGFLDVDAALEEQVLNFTENSTNQKDNWARKKFDNWRKLSGLNCEIPLEKLGLRVLNDLLSKFFLVVCKSRGCLFPADTFMGMLRCFGRLAKKEQELRIASSGISKVPFDIARNPIFKSTQSSVLVAMHRSVARGVCKDRKKASRAMFSCGSDELGPFVRFCERSSKNYKVDLNHFQPEHFRSQVTVRDANFKSSNRGVVQLEQSIFEVSKLSCEKHWCEIWCCRILLNELPFESARALGIASQSVPTRGVSNFPVCNMSNCVVNVYVGKDVVPFEK
ncbi:hypothetical protein L7F22_055073 [Adiantum nelumboides]|nr:hypothetical protein [Adiantum nelumboides]